MVFIAAASIGLGLERGGRNQEPLIACQIGDIESEPGDEELPFIEKPHDYNASGRGVAVTEGRWIEIAGGVDLAIDSDVLECRIGFDVDIELIAAEQDELNGPLRADKVLEILQGRDARALRLRLPGQNLAGGILSQGLKRLAGEEHDGRLQDRKQQREEKRRDERKFDRGRTAAATTEPAKDIISGGGI